MKNIKNRVRAWAKQTDFYELGSNVTMIIFILADLSYFAWIIALIIMTLRGDIVL